MMDLPVWEKTHQPRPSLSVIIPTLNEAEQLPLTLKHVSAGEPAEVIVTDGGSRDSTLRIARAHGAEIVNGPPNRARQMNAGAAVARSETLLFLHADTLLPANYRESIVEALRQPLVVWGSFRFRIADPFAGRRFVECSTNARSRLLRMPYGDQALFVRRSVFEALGGFRNLPIMEDYEFVSRLRRLGRVALLNEAVLTSGRRWQRLGALRTTLINHLMIIGYHFGVSPIRLAALYRGQSPRRQGDAAGPPRHKTSNRLSQ
jgi:rSAM/selenodomain-associated transferase 2